ncbi:MAG: endonuclease VII domain-containing protein [Candidatus Udaeobacter sp.]
MRRRAKKREHDADADRRSRERNKDKIRASRLVRKYGISVEDYDELLAAQNGKCAICGELGTKETRLHIDHCEDSGNIRGLLCVRCNAGMGYFHHDIRILARAIEYIALCKGPRQPVPESQKRAMTKAEFLAGFEPHGLLGNTFVGRKNGL